MSILCVGMGWYPHAAGGLNRYVYELTHHLAAVQNQVELYAVGVPETSPNAAVNLINLAEPTSPMWHRLWSVRTNFSRSSTAKPDAINLHFALYSLPLLSNLSDDVPVTFTFHGPWALESAQEGVHKLNVGMRHWIERRVYSRCDRFIVLSQAFGTILHQHYRIPWNKIHVIPGGVDTHRFRPNLAPRQAREYLNWPDDRPILFAPRRLVQRMGLDKLLSALAQVKSKIPDVWLAIAGKGYLRSALEQQVMELGLENHVCFLGFLPDEQLPIAYQAADLTVIPSQSLEGFGLVVVESLACGTPVLCTPVGGMPEILAHFSPQLIADAATVEAIALRLEAVLNGTIPLPSRTDCSDYAAKNFNWFNITQQVQHVLLA
ncbi:MAG: glycosyltransferase family 4 protein [Cyanobacteria bacterium CRU_2_1]|nr:glycosyltransferase family 4 protein [Cyanobacteria bacterium RU_5_0]NJR60483.1 glycosyltransferase family 4 protein [Cyanobacteria bacterium CRU_2_1]